MNHTLPVLLLCVGACSNMSASAQTPGLPGHTASADCTAPFDVTRAGKAGSALAVCSSRIFERSVRASVAGGLISPPGAGPYPVFTSPVTFALEDTTLPAASGMETE